MAMTSHRSQVILLSLFITTVSQSLAFALSIDLALLFDIDLAIAPFGPPVSGNRVFWSATAERPLYVTPRPIFLGPSK
jgi:hypothetical protein